MFGKVNKTRFFSRLLLVNPCLTRRGCILVNPRPTRGGGDGGGYHPLAVFMTHD